MATLTRDFDINEEIIKIDDVFDTFEEKLNKTNTITNSTIEYPTTQAITNLYNYIMSQVNALIAAIPPLPQFNPPPFERLIGRWENYSIFPQTYNFNGSNRDNGPGWYRVEVSGGGGGGGGGLDTRFSSYYYSGAGGSGGRSTQTFLVLAGGEASISIGSGGGGGYPQSYDKGGSRGRGSYGNGFDGSYIPSADYVILWPGSGGGGGGASAFFFPNNNIKVIGGGGGGGSGGGGIVSSAIRNAPDGGGGGGGAIGVRPLELNSVWKVITYQYNYSSNIGGTPGKGTEQDGKGYNGRGNLQDNLWSQMGSNGGAGVLNDIGYTGTDGYVELYKLYSLGE
jgi:hypothetical protein